MGNHEEPLFDKTIALAYDGPQRQLVDLGSRFGRRRDQAPSSFGFDHGAIASQREGRHSMSHLSRVGLLDCNSCEAWCNDVPAERRVIWTSMHYHAHTMARAMAVGEERLQDP